MSMLFRRVCVVLVVVLVGCTDDEDAAPHPSVGSSTTAGGTGTTTTSRAADPRSDPITRPVTDPDVCEARSARDVTLTDATLHLFAISREAPIPIQIIGRDDDNPYDAFAVVERFFTTDLHMSGNPIDIGGASVELLTYGNGNGDARWRLPDGSFGYLRSRGFDEATLVAVLGALAPRAPGSTIPGFDLDASATGVRGLGLLHERMSTGVSGRVATVECTVEASGYIYRIAAVDGDPVLEHAAVIDRPVPLAVEARDGRVIIIDGIVDPAAPTLDDVTNADADEWSQLLGTPRPIP
jgi:hypothetical protein